MTDKNSNILVGKLMKRVIIRRKCIVAARKRSIIRQSQRERGGQNSRKYNKNNRQSISILLSNWEKAFFVDSHFMWCGKWQIWPRPQQIRPLFQSQKSKKDHFYCCRVIYCWCAKFNRLQFRFREWILLPQVSNSEITLCYIVRGKKIFFVLLLLLLLLLYEKALYVYMCLSLTRRCLYSTCCINMYAIKRYASATYTHAHTVQHTDERDQTRRNYRIMTDHKLERQRKEEFILFCTVFEKRVSCFIVFACCCCCCCSFYPTKRVCFIISVFRLCVTIFVCLFDFRLNWKYTFFWILTNQLLDNDLFGSKHIAPLPP